MMSDSSSVQQQEAKKEKVLSGVQHEGTGMGGKGGRRFEYSSYHNTRRTEHADLPARISVEFFADESSPDCSLLRIGG